MRWICSLAALAALSHPVLADEWGKQWQIAGKAELRVDVDDGRVIVRGAPIHQIEAHVYTTGWKIGSGGVTISERQAGSRVEIDVRVPRSDRWFNVNNRAIRVELRVPQETAANIRTGDGAILAEGLRGATKLRTGDGRIEALDLDGGLSADTGDGGIRARGRFDLLDLRTGDGSIEADITEGSRVTSAWDINTGDGQITLRVPSTLAADVEAHCGDGRVTSDLPLQSMRKDGNHDLRGRLNGGGRMLKIHTGDGSIRISRL
jgi:hypothetical protein